MKKSIHLRNASIDDSGGRIPIDKLQREARDHRPPFSQMRHVTIMQRLDQEHDRRSASLRTRSIFLSCRPGWLATAAGLFALSVTLTYTLWHRVPASHNSPVQLSHSSEGAPIIEMEREHEKSSARERAFDDESAARPSYDLLSSGVYWLLNQPTLINDSVSTLIEPEGTASPPEAAGNGAEANIKPEPSVMVGFNRIEIDIGDQTIGSLAGRFLGR